MISSFLRKKRFLLVKLCFSLNFIRDFIPLNPDPRAQINPDPTGFGSTLLLNTIRLQGVQLRQLCWSTTLYRHYSWSSSVQWRYVRWVYTVQCTLQLKQQCTIKICTRDVHSTVYTTAGAVCTMEIYTRVVHTTVYTTAGGMVYTPDIKGVYCTLHTVHYVQCIVQLEQQSLLKKKHVLYTVLFTVHCTLEIYTVNTILYTE